MAETASSNRGTPFHTSWWGHGVYKLLRWCVHVYIYIYIYMHMYMYIWKACMHGTIIMGLFCLTFLGAFVILWPYRHQNHVLCFFHFFLKSVFFYFLRKRNFHQNHIRFLTFVTLQAVRIMIYLCKWQRYKKSNSVSQLNLVTTAKISSSVETLKNKK